MDPNSFSQPQGAIVSGPDVPSPAPAGGLVFTDAPVKKSKKGIIIAIIVVLVVAALGVVAFLLPHDSSNATLDADAYNQLIDFKNEYEEFFSIYDTLIGYSPNLATREFASYYPLEKDLLVMLKGKVYGLSESLDSLNKAFSINQETRQLKNDILATIKDAQSNIDLLYSYEDAFIEPIYNQLPNKDTKCYNSVSIEALRISDTADAAESYLSLYCAAVKSDTDTTELIKKSIKILTKYVKSVDNQSAAISQVQELINGAIVK